MLKETSSISKGGSMYISLTSSLSNLFYEMFSSQPIQPTQPVVKEQSDIEILRSELCFEFVDLNIYNLKTAQDICKHLEKKDIERMLENLSDTRFDQLQYDCMSASYGVPEMFYLS